MVVLQYLADFGSDFVWKIGLKCWEYLCLAINTYILNTS